MTPRETAVQVLLAVEQGEKSHLALEEALQRNTSLDARDERFIRRVVRGTLEKRRLLDHRINQKSKMPVEKQKPRIRQILRMSAYQICFMDKTPNAAVIHEAVEMTKRAHMLGLAGFVNAVLRAVSREDNWTGESEEITSGIPEWLLSQWRQEYGAETTARMVTGITGGERLTFTRQEALVEEEKLLQSLEAEGCRVEKAAFPDSAYILTLGRPLKTLTAFQRGWIHIQDISSVLAAELAVDEYRTDGSKMTGRKTDSQKAEEDLPVRVLDVCAAPGGKSIRMAQLLGGRAQIRACDLTAEKVERMRENLKRSGTKGVLPMVQDAREFVPAWEGKMDIVLADLPCSGLGVMGRKPEIRYLISPEQIDSLQRLQREILQNVSRYVRPGGVLLYSTCTICRAENTENADFIRKELPFESVDLRPQLPEFLQNEASAPEGWLQLLPGVHPSDGFFVAKFRRRQG